nr:MAG TPA: hypothetical protein [Caudoviricetes sp.]
MFHKKLISYYQKLTILLFLSRHQEIKHDKRLKLAGESYFLQ